MVIELLFFVIGILPYWYTLYLPEKDYRYWGVLVWCCLVWLCYFSYHQAMAAVLNNLVELGFASWGLRKWLTHQKEHGKSLEPTNETPPLIL